MAAAALLHGVGHQFLPVEAPAQCEERIAFAECARHGIQVLLVIEQGLIHELLILEFLRGFGARDQVEESSAAQRVHIDIHHRGVLGGKQSGQLGRRCRRAETRPVHGQHERGACRGQ